MPKDDEASSGGPVLTAAKWALMALGAVVVAGVLFKPLLLLALVGGAGYFGYRWLTKSKALGGSDRRSLPGADDYAAKMRRLDALDRKLDRDIGD